MMLAKSHLLLDRTLGDHAARLRAAPPPPADDVQLTRPAWRAPTLGRQTVALIGADAVALAAAVAIAGVRPLGAVAYALAVLVGLAMVRTTRLPLSPSVLRDAPVVAKCAGTVAVVLSPLAALTHAPVSLAWMPLAAVACVLFVRTCTYRVIAALRRRGRLTERALVVASPDVVARMGDGMRSRPETGLIPVERRVIDLTTGTDARHLRDAQRALDILDPSRVILDPDWLSAGEAAELVDAARSRGVEVHVIARPAQQLARTSDIDELWGFPVYRLSVGELPPSWHLKRPMEFVVAAAILLFLLPVLGIVALAVKLSSRGPILFRQSRVGQNGRLIEVLKFRTYPVNHVDDKWSPTNGDCPLAVGRLLRRTSLDELPQLWNVLRGDMSLIGPRPERPHFVEPLHGTVEGYAARHRLPMGLTGLAQVNGLWGQTSIDDRVRFDNQYIDSWSLWGDVVILLRTVPELVRRVVSS